MIDITKEQNLVREKAKMEEELQKLQKMESLGKLATGIAHDLNNILAVITGNLSLYQAKNEGTIENAKLLENIQTATEQASQLTQELLAFSGQGNFHLNHCNINTILEGMQGVLESSIPKSITFELKTDEKVDTIFIDEVQLKQAILNLIINAAEAMENETSGTITVSTGLEQVKEEIAGNIFFGKHHFDEYIDKEMVYVETTDTGSGIPDEIKDDIFNPFFTTKTEGRGFGLAIIQGIVIGHGGFITLQSQVGEGTSIRLYFPVSGGDYKEILPYIAKPIHKSLNIIFADDEKGIRNTAKDILEYLGHQVLLAKNGQEVIDLSKSMQRDIDLIILDLTMPVLSGPDTYREIRDEDPSLPILLTSGYTESDVFELINDLQVHESIEENNTSFMQKPFTYSDLEVAISQLIHR